MAGVEAELLRSALGSSGDLAEDDLCRCTARVPRTGPRTVAATDIAFALRCELFGPYDQNEACLERSNLTLFAAPLSQQFSVYLHSNSHEGVHPPAHGATSHLHAHFAISSTLQSQAIWPRHGCCTRPRRHKYRSSTPCPTRGPVGGRRRRGCGRCSSKVWLGCEPETRLRIRTKRDGDPGGQHTAATGRNSQQQ